MKTLITTTALVAILAASSVSANLFESATLGDSGTFPAECFFQSSNNNTMERDGVTWSTTGVDSNGSINVKMRGATTLTISNDATLRHAGGAAVAAVGGGVVAMTHDYQTGTYSSVVTDANNTQATSSVNTSTITANNTSDNVHSYYDYKVNIGGSSVMSTASGDFPRWSLNGNTTYRLNHTASCTQ